MHFLVLLVSLLSVNVHHDCGAVNPTINGAAWTHHGHAYTARYRDMGDKLVWNTRVPRYVRHLATDNTGRAIRLQCLR